jgi:AcrR family transcriptional regulator
MLSTKDQILSAAIDYVSHKGVSGLSLRPLASAIGTSARMLIFHFKSKEQLLEELLTEVQTRQRRLLERLSAPHGPNAASPMRHLWDQMTKPQNLPALRLLYEAHFIAMQDQKHFGGYLSNTSSEWLLLIIERLPPPLQSRPMATLCAAVFDGLVIELLSTGDARRTGKALEEFVALLLLRMKTKRRLR